MKSLFQVLTLAVVAFLYAQGCSPGWPCWPRNYCPCPAHAWTSGPCLDGTPCTPCCGYTPCADLYFCWKCDNCRTGAGGRSGEPETDEDGNKIPMEAPYGSFGTLDLDGDGHLDIFEAEAIIRSGGCGNYTEKIPDLFDHFGELDTNKDRKLDWIEISGIVSEEEYNRKSK